MSSTGKPKVSSTGKPTTDPKEISKEDWARGTSESPDDFTEQEGGPTRSQPDPDRPDKPEDR